jgi:tetratricopeptide (TPR) repeat protein
MRNSLLLFLLLTSIGSVAFGQTWQKQQKRIQLHVTLGDNFYLLEEYDRAIAEYDIALRAESNDAAILNKRGLAWLGKKDEGMALRDFNQAIKLKPDFANYWHNRGVAWYQKNKLEKAIADFNQALRLKPLFAEALMARGLTRLRQNKESEAEKDFEQSVKLDAKLLTPISLNIERMKSGFVAKR